MSLRGMTIGIAILLFVPSCSAPPQKPIPPDAKPLGQYSKEEISEHAETLLKEIELGDEVRTSVMTRLAELLADPDFAPRVDSPGVNGIAVFQYGGGGMMFGGGAGSGIARFHGGDQETAFEAKGFSVGASAGGTNTFGIILILGLDHEQRFPDIYRLRGTGGSLGSTSYLVAEGAPDRGFHRIHIVGSGIGVGGQAGRARVTIRVHES